MSQHALAWIGFCLLTASAMAAEPAAKRAARLTQPREARNAEAMKETAEHVFKTIGDVQLRLYVFQPQDHKASDRRPAIVFFFGGGWTSGTPHQFAQQCRYLASRGMVAVTAEYRIRSKHDVTIPQCVTDAKSAVRWVRAHAAELGVDPDRIASGGGSAGGHLAACVGVVPGLDEPGEDASVSSRSNAMVLFNPVMTLGPAEGLSEQYAARLGDRRKQFGGDPQVVSPSHHIRAGQPPAIMFFGSADGLLEGAQVFDRRYRAAGNRSELKISPGPGHGFFNYGREGNRYFVETCREMDRFLVSLGYLEGEPTIEPFLRGIER